MSVTFGFTVEELESSPDESFDETGGVSNTRRFKVPWASRWAFVNGMRRAHYPGFTAVLAEKFRIKPFVNNPANQTITDLTATLNAHDYAEVQVQYTSVENATREEQPDGTYLSYRQSSTVEFQTVPSRALKWSSDSALVAPDAHATIMIPITTHVLTWSDVQNPPWELISAARGKLNSQAYAVPVIGLNVEAEGLLFNSCETSGKFSVSGNTEWELTIELIEKQITAFSDGATVYGWNHQFRDDTNGWDKPVDDSGNLTFQTTDFSNLFSQV